MTFDNQIPEWKNTGTEPDAELKETGFTSGYKPPAGIFNWFWSLVSKAITEIQTKLSNHATNSENPHKVTAAQVGLGDVDNTKDSEKNVKFASEAGVGRKVENALIIRYNGGKTEGTDLFTYDGSGGKSLNLTPDKLNAAEKVHKHTFDDVAETAQKKMNYLAIATSTDGIAYTATIEGITELYNGLKITIIPNMTSTQRAVTLDVNGLGAKNLRCSIGGYNFGNAGTIAAIDTWLGENSPVTFEYKAKFDNWQTIISRPSVTGLYGTLKVEQGGTGATTAEGALKNLGVAMQKHIASPIYSANTVYRKLGNLVTINIYCADALQTGTLNAWNTLFTLPTDYRPSETIAFVILDNSSNNTAVKNIHYHGRVTPEGKVDIFLFDTYNIVPFGSVAFLID